MSYPEFDWEQHAINLEAELAKVTAERDVWLNCFKLTEPETEKLKVERDQLAAEKAALERERDELKLLHEQSLRVQDNYELEERRNEQMRIVAENAERRLVKERDSLKAQLAEAREWADKCEKSQAAWQERHAGALQEIDILKRQLSEVLALPSTDGFGPGGVEIIRAALAQEQP